MLNLDDHFILNNFADEMVAGLIDLLYVLKEIPSDDQNLNDSLVFVSQSIPKLSYLQKRSIICNSRIVSAIENMQIMLSKISLGEIGSGKWKFYSSVLARMAISIALSVKETRHFTFDLLIDSEFLIPGTDYYIEFENSPANISGEIIVENGSIVPGNFLLKNITVSGTNGLLVAFPERAISPPISDTVLIASDSAEMEKWHENLREAFGFLKLHSASECLVSLFGREVAPIRRELHNVQSSVSFDHFPGTIFSSNCYSAEFLAETLVHESDHQKHYLITWVTSIWKQSEADQAARFRSPWRDDPRPLDGLLRGASAFVRVSEFWEAVDKIINSDKLNNEWIACRSVLTNFQAVDSLITISCEGGLDEGGRALAKNLHSRAQLVKDRLLTRRGFAERLAYSMREQNTHDAAWIFRNPNFAQNANCLSEDSYVGFGNRS